MSALVSPYKPRALFVSLQPTDYLYLVSPRQLLPSSLPAQKVGHNIHHLRNIVIRITRKVLAFLSTAAPQCLIFTRSTLLHPHPQPPCPLRKSSQHPPCRRPPHSLAGCPRAAPASSSPRGQTTRPSPRVSSARPCSTSSSPHQAPSRSRRSRPTSG